MFKTNIKGLLFFAIISSCLQATEFKKACETDQECVEFYNSSYVCSNKTCGHSPLFPLDTQKTICLFLIFILSIFTNASGIGGAAIFIPLYLSMLNFTIGDAIPLANVTVLAGGITTISLIYKERDPEDKNVLLIDYKLSSFIIPMMSAGTMVGVIAVKVLPASILFSFLVIYIFYSTNKVVNKGIQQHHIEQEKKKNELNVELVEKGKAPENQERLKTFQEIFEPDRKNMTFCVLTYFIILLCALLRGGKGTGSLIGLDQCSFFSWLLFFITIAILSYGTIIQWINQKRMENMDIETIQNKQSNDTSYARIFQKLLFTVFYSGILAGSLGLGGGLVINPVLLSEGFRPEKASAVSALIVLFTAMTTSTQFLIAGAFDFGYAFYIMITSIVGSYLGNIFLKKLVKKYDKPSLFIWILAALLLVSGIVLGITGSIRLL